MALNITLSSKNDLSAISLANIEILAEAEFTVDRDGILIVQMKDNTDDPRDCVTEKLVEVTVNLGNGKTEVQYKVQRVRGLENTCKRKPDSTCNAFACYSNS